jgi:integrase
MNRIELDTEPTMQSLYALISPAQRTWDTYLTAMMHYTDFTGMTPTQLIDEGNADIQAGKLMTQRRVFTRLPKFRQYLETATTPQASKPLAPGTLNKYLQTVSSFYKYFYIEVPKQPRSKNKCKPVKENMKRATKEDIHKAQAVTNQRDNAIMLCGISSGMGAAEIASLTVEAFKDGYDPETGITTFDMRRGKVEVDFITFISPEASQAVIQYLEWRDRPPARPDNKRDVMEYEKRKVTSDSFLFISSKVSPEYLETHNEDIRKCKPETIVKIYNRISNNANMGGQKGVYNVIRSHNMRKYFNSNLKNAGCDGDLVEYFMGHTLDGSKSAYYEGDPVKLREIYTKFIPFITIQKELDLSESPEYIATVAQNEILTKVNAENVVKMERMTQLEIKIKEMERQQEAIGALMKLVNDNPILQETLFKKQKEEG